MRVPTAKELLDDPKLRSALESAWTDSKFGDPGSRHEEGGWVFMNTSTGAISIYRARPGIQAFINLNNPPKIEGSVPIATFHTHPNPVAEGWNPGPSAVDTESAWLLGVPCFIRG